MPSANRKRFCIMYNHYYTRRQETRFPIRIGRIIRIKIMKKTFCEHHENMCFENVERGKFRRRECIIEFNNFM